MSLGRMNTPYATVGYPQSAPRAMPAHTPLNWTKFVRLLNFGLMKIAFIGSHGVGKTTLCFELAAALKRLDLSVDVVKEVARGCPLPINQATTVAAQTVLPKPIEAQT